MTNQLEDQLYHLQQALQTQDIKMEAIYTNDGYIRQTYTYIHCHDYNGEWKRIETLVPLLHFDG